MEGEATLFTQDPDTNEYVAYTPPSFQESIPENLREHESLKEIADLGQLAEKHVELFSAQPQRPESPEAYAFGIPEGFPIVEADLNAFKKGAYESGLTQEQFKAVMGHYIERETRLAEQYKADIEAHREESMNQLKMEFGDSAEEKIQKASQFLVGLGEKLGGDNVEKVRAWLDDTKFGDDPMVIRLLSKAAELISEDLFIKGEHRNDGGERPKGVDGEPRLKFTSMGD